MGRRPITETVRCAETGCGERAFYEHATQREAAEARKDRAKTPYRCTRHTKPDEVLSVVSPTRVGVLVASRVESRFGGYLDGLYWIAEGSGTGGGSRFTYGPGFKAFTADFPEGTRLVVTARIERPEVSKDGA